jgi:PadR family transcriptional regulator PadR
MMAELTAFRRDLLYIISGVEAPSGLAIKEELDEYYDQKTTPGRLYPNLNVLVDEGLVEKSQIDQRTNAYALTQRGQRAIEARSAWEAQYITS